MKTSVWYCAFAFCFSCAPLASEQSELVFSDSREPLPLSDWQAADAGANALSQHADAAEVALNEGFVASGEGGAQVNSEQDSSLDAEVAPIGTLALRMVDAPVAYDEVWITFCDVQVRRADGTLNGEAALDERSAAEADPTSATADTTETTTASDDAAGWIEVGGECHTVDLLTLQGGAFQSLGVTQLAAGAYDQVRLSLIDAAVVVEGVRHSLDVPSGAESGLKLRADFTLVADAVTTVTIDFDASRSLHVTGSGRYVLVPVLALQSVETTSE